MNEVKTNLELILDKLTSISKENWNKNFWKKIS